MLLKELVKIIESKYSPNLAYEWDNVGLLVGDYGSGVKRVLLALDADESVIEEAVERGVDIIITHHPFLFKGMKKINSSSYRGRAVIRLIKEDISLYSMHTNFDIARDGLNDGLCRKMGLKNIEDLSIIQAEKLVKIAIYAPKTHEDAVRRALAEGGAGHIGNYDSCSFSTDGVGRFRPLEGSNPHVGRKDMVCDIEEVKIESVLPKEKLNSALEHVFSVHPYEEVAYDMYELLNEGDSIGIGRIGETEREVGLEEFAEGLKRGLDIELLKIAGDPKMNVKRVAVVSGSGSEFMGESVKKGAQVIVTGDVKYHQAQEALEKGIAVVDVGHYGSEKIFAEIMSEFLKGSTKGVEILTSNASSDVFWSI
ncbi:dinuclear metal center protein, YbgI/SA1388 family [Peptoclostridium litorale DSM 5388]|uniref:GTP cyclohydrolase 1 type 2 homolog n=1 Tax=Peptoclostridium litorale DSM 5388 TaxID=1121324 RepID=A0A069RLU5_PEPLI|nr:Nif3-like dinuclear metal center hexameric protein [Peptoclostridium litorale]KDR95147.1 putative GTP cyclohydrolase 1 type 2 [Peptoclostridium litorale DSM 5388]SIN74238.1 dinuclear metal center protein, YbgI/SA1388 family [Peptoclostridium litorale DSM 5388]